jgi:surface protein
VEDGADAPHESKYVHLCPTLFWSWTRSLNLFLILFFHPCVIVVILHNFLSPTFVSIVFYVRVVYTVFDGAAAFNADISNWDTGKVEYMSYSTSTSVPPFFLMGDVTDFFFLHHSSITIVSIVFYVRFVGSISIC